jgi:hypothetical protein
MVGELNYEWEQGQEKLADVLDMRENLEERQIVGELKYEQEQGQEELVEGLDVGDDLKETFLDQIEPVKPAAYSDSDHMYCNQKMSMA